MEIDASTRADLTSVSITADFTGHAEAFEGRVEISSDAGGCCSPAAGHAGLIEGIQGTRRLQFGFDDLPLGGGAFRVAVSACEPGVDRPWHTDASARFVVQGPSAGAPLVSAVKAQELPTD